MLSLLPIGKNLFNIPPSVEHTHNFGPAILQTIENNFRSSGERAQTCPNFVTRPASKRKVVNSGNDRRNLTHDFVSCRSPGDARVVVPKVVNIAESLRRPKNRGLCPAMP